MRVQLRKYDSSSYVSHVQADVSADGQQSLALSTDGSSKFQVRIFATTFASGASFTLDDFTISKDSLCPIYWSQDTGVYRFGFQNQEKDDEVKGMGNSVNFRYRMHDPRLGRFLSVDPIFADYPYNSSYAFAENKLGLGREFEGLELITWGVGDVVVYRPLIGLMESNNIIPRPLTTPKGRPVELIEHNLGNGRLIPRYNPRLTGTENWVNMTGMGRYAHNLVRQTAKWKEVFGDVMGKQFKPGANGKSSNLKPDGNITKGAEGIMGEVKSATRTGIRRGLKELDKYIDVAEKLYPEVSNWRAVLHTYRSFIPLEMTHTVAQNESPSGISQQYGISVDLFYKMNNMKPGDALHPNQLVVVSVNFIQESPPPLEVPNNVQNQQDNLKHN